MVGLAHAQHGNAKAVEQRAQRIVSDAVRIPVRQNDHCAIAVCGKPAGIHQIVFRIRRAHRRGEPQKHALALRCLIASVAAGGKELDFALLQAEIRGRFVGKELITTRDNAIIQPVQITFIFGFRTGTIAVHQRPALGPFHAPLQRTHNPVGIARGETGLPCIHPFLIKAGHEGFSRF